MDKIDIAWIDPGYTTGKFTLSIAGTCADLADAGRLGRLHRMSTSLPALGRNTLVRDGFLAGNSPWLWMVDSDMVFDKGHVLKLLDTAREQAAKIVSGLSFIFKDASLPIPAYFLEDDDKQLHMMNLVPGDVMEVAATGLASTLIHREVFEKMEAPRHEDYRWFDQIMLEGNDQLSGEDTQFFVRARALGYRVFLNPNAETWHVKEVGVGKADFVRHWELAERLNAS